MRGMLVTIMTEMMRRRKTLNGIVRKLEKNQTRK